MNYFVLGAIVGGIADFLLGCFVGTLWQGHSDAQALLDARIAKESAETERQSQQRSATRWQEQATQRQTIADLELSLGLEAANETIVQVRKELAHMTQERDALALQLRERSAVPEQQYALKTPKIAPARPKQGRPPSSSPR